MTARAGADAVTGALARMLVGIFFRSHEVSGADHVTGSGPLILVANHQNGLVDGLVLIAACRRHLRFLGKSTLWRIPPLRPFLALAGVVPVYRSADTADGLSAAGRSERNRAALARCRDLLAGGGAIGIFPEGVSHDLASLQELRSGAARLAVLAATDGVTGVGVVPVGLVYDDKTRFRSRVLVRFGPARAVDDHAEAYRRDPHAAVDDLTRQIAADLRTVGPDYRSAEDAERFAALADLAVDPAGPGPVSAVGHGLERRDDLARRLAAVALDPATRPDVDRLEVLRARYENGLRRAGLDDTGVRMAITGGTGAPADRRRSALGPLPGIAVVAVTGVGVAIHALPYGAIKVLGGLPPNRGMRSTVKLLGSFGLYNLTYLFLAAVVGRRRGPVAALVAMAAAPLSGWIALRTLEEAEDLGGARRAAAAVAGRRTAVARLGADRLALAAAVRQAAARP